MKKFFSVGAEMKRSESLTAKLNACDPDVKLYVKEMEALNLKLHKQLAKLQSQNTDYQHQIAALKMAQPNIQVNLVGFQGKKDQAATDQPIKK